MTVGENLNIVLRAHGVECKARAPRMNAMLTRLRMEGFSDRLPSQLSGGQQQRVAMARMLIAEPDILMLDEPLSARDSYLRHEIEDELMEMLGASRAPCCSSRTVATKSTGSATAWRFSIGDNTSD